MSSAPTQPSTNRKLFRKLFLFVALGAAGFGVYKGTVSILKADPLKGYKAEVKNALPPNVAVFMKDTDFTRVEPNQPAAKCFVNEMRIAQNRQMYDFVGVSKGQLTWKKALYEFSAERGNWNGYAKQLVLDGKVKLKSAKFDLASQELSYDEANKTFRVPRPVTGKLYGGEVKVANFVYYMDKEEYSTGAGEWKGVLSGFPQGEVPTGDTKKVWEFKYDTYGRKDGFDVFTDARATDGEVIIIAKNIKREVKTDVLTATGDVKYFGKKANMIADKIVVYRKEKRALMTGHVTMLVKPKSQENDKLAEGSLPPMLPAVPSSISKNRPPAPKDKDAQKKREDTIRSGSNLRDYPLTITAEKVEYWYKKGERRAKINGSPQARQELPEGEWRYIWAYSAFYDDEKETLKLESAPGKADIIMKNSLDDEMYGVSGTIVTKEGVDEFEFKTGNGKLSTNDDDDIPPAKSGSGGGGLAGPIGNRGT